MTKRNGSIRAALLASSALAIASSAFAAEVTPERLLNADREPHNWLMNHRTYDGQRFSPLARITRDNVRNLKLAYAVPLGGATGNEWLEATPLVEDGFLYMTDAWGVLYKIDVRSGDVGRIVWRMEPKQERPQTNRGAALWGNFVITSANWPARIIATDKETGKVVWEANMTTDQPELRITAAPLACATMWRRSTRRPESCCGASSPYRRPASPAARHGRAIPTPGGRAAPPCGLRAPMTRRPTRRSGARATPCRCSTRSIAPATTSTPTA